MAVTVTCPSCGSSYPVGEEILGKKIRCKGCQAVFAAAGAKAKVGAGVGTDKPAAPTIPRGSNGVAHREDLAPKARTQPSTGGISPAVMIGGGVALLAMIGVTVWALFIRESGTISANQSNSNSSTPVKIAIAETPVTENKSEPKKEPVKVTTAPKEEPKKFGPAKFIDRPRNLPYQIDPEVSTRVQRSAVWIKAGGGFGSGWFAEPNIVVTNSHVIGMENPSAAPPEWIKVVVDSGIPGKERDFEAKILGLDRENDLAVLRVDGENLPDPVTIARSSELVEGQKLYTVGFPLGNKTAKIFSDGKENLVTSVKVRQTHVSGRMPTKSGSIKYVQIESGASHGNSGSMIVDSAGHARLVLVAGFDISTDAICFGIPSEYAIDLLQGRLLRVVPLQPYLDGSVVKQELIGMVADPMKRIKSVALELWTGDPGRKIRPAANSQPAPEANDSPRLTVELAYDPNEKIALGASAEAKGQWEMPELADGKVYWVQPRYTGTDGQVRWGEAGVMNMAHLPVQRKPAYLVQKHQAGTERKIKLESHNAIGVGGTSYGIQDSGLLLDLIEKTASVTPDGSGKIEVKYADLKFTNADREFYMRTLLKGVHEAAKGMTSEMIVSKKGQIRMPKMGMKNVPVLIRPFVERFNLQTLQSLESLSLALPDREVQPGETWQHDQNFTVTLDPRLSENGLFHMTYRYMGSRVREGREEAVIEFTGKIVRGEGIEPPPLPPSVNPEAKDKKGDKPTILKVRELHGQARGAALLDLATGQVTLARIVAEMEFDIPLTFFDLKVGAKQRMDLRRFVTPGSNTAWEPNTLLPNQELQLNPFVGSPDSSLSQAPGR